VFSNILLAQRSTFKCYLPSQVTPFQTDHSEVCDYSAAPLSPLNLWQNDKDILEIWCSYYETRNARRLWYFL